MRQSRYATFRGKFFFKIDFLGLLERKGQVELAAQARTSE